MRPTKSQKADLSKRALTQAEFIFNRAENTIDIEEALYWYAISWQWLFIWVRGEYL